MASAKARLATKSRQNTVTLDSGHTVIPYSNDFFKAFKLTSGQAGLSAQAHFMVYTWQNISKQTFQDENFKAMLRTVAQDVNVPLLTRVGLSHYIQGEFNVLLCFSSILKKRSGNHRMEIYFSKVFMKVELYLTI